MRSRAAARLIACAALCAAASARAESKRVEVSLMCPVTAVDATAVDGTVALTIGRGRDDLLTLGLHGWVLGKGEKSGISDKAGRAEVVALEAASARVVVRPDPGVRRAALVEGAQFEARILVSPEVHRGQLFELMLLGISFVDNRRQPFTTLKELLAARDDAVERRVLAAMVAAGREVIEFTGEYKKPVSHGKWAGRLMADILGASGPEDLAPFLRFVLDYPGKYIAHDWKISETWATWILNDMPMAQVDAYGELAALPAGPALAAAAARMKPSDLSLLADFVVTRVEALPAEHGAEAAPYLAFLDRLVAARVDAPPGLRARVEQARAEARKREPGKALEAVPLLRRAADLHEQAGEPNEALMARNNALSALLDAQRYDEVRAGAAEVRRLVQREQALATGQDPLLRISLGLREAYAIRIEALLAGKRGEYRQVIESLEPLVERYGQAGMNDVRGPQIDMLGEIARAQRKLGKLDEARASYQRLDGLAEQLGDTARQGKVAFDVGEMLWEASRWEEARAQYGRAAALAIRAGDRGETARAMAAEAQGLWQLGRPKEALARHQEALALRKEVGDRSGTAWQLLEMAKIRRELGDRDQARGLLDEALAIRRALGQRESEAEVDLELAELHLALKQPDAAEADFTAARALYAALANLPDEARCLLGLARSDQARRRFEAARGRVGEAVALYQKIGNKRALADALLWHSQLLEGRGDRAAARAAIEQARALAPDDGGMRIDTLDALANLDLSEGELGSARERSDEAIRLAEAAKDARRRLQTLRSRIRRQVLNAEYDAALATSEQRIELARASGARPALADALEQRASQLTSLGRLADATRAAAEALAVAEQNDDPAQRAWALSTQAAVANAYGRQQERLRLFDLALPLGRASGDPYTEGAMVANRSFALVELRDLDGALAEGRRAEAIAGTTSTDEMRLKILAVRGEILWRKGALAEAEAALSQALALSRRSLPQQIPWLLVQAGRVTADRGDLRAALLGVDEAVALERARPGKPYDALGEQGMLLARAGEDQKAAPVLREVVARAEARGGVLPWEPLYWLGSVEARGGQVAAALATLGRAVKAIEGGESALTDDRARARYFSDKAGVYQLLIKLLLAKGDVEGALRYLERAKAAELADVQRRAGPGSDPEALYASELESQEARFEQLVDEELRRPRPDAERLRRLRESLTSIRRRRAAFLEKLDRNSALFDRYALRPLELEKIQGHLPAGVLLVSPVLLDDRVVVFAVSARGITHRESIIPSTEVARLVEALRSEMHARHLAGEIEAEGSLSPVQASLDRALPIAQRLYDVLLRPVLDGVEAPRTLVVSPAGVLRYLPFAALHDGKQWLVERTTLLGMTTLDRENLAVSARGKPHGATLLAVSNPDGTLPGARREVDAVRKLFVGSAMLDGPAATLDALRDRLRVPGYDILHLAAHGKLDAVNPDQSRILMAGEALTYADIPALRATRTRLVVLSACDTAVGTGGTGVEIAGLAYQFQRTDVRTVLATLWPVDDATTAQLMTEFYGQVKAGRSYPEALAMAQRKLATGADPRSRHPVYWAPFMLLGAP